MKPRKHAGKKVVDMSHVAARDYAEAKCRRYCGSLRSARPCDGVEVFRLVRRVNIRRNETDELGREPGRLVRVLTLVHPCESEERFSSVHERVEVAAGRVDPFLGVEELPAVAVERVPWPARPGHDDDGDADSEQDLPHRFTPERDIGVRGAKLNAGSGGVVALFGEILCPRRARCTIIRRKGCVPRDAALQLRPIMPARSKFTERRREQILQILRAGGTRVDATRAAGVTPMTFRRWLQRGRTSKAPDGRWARFYCEVCEAEGAPPELQVLRDRFETAMGTAEGAWRFLEELEREDVPAVKAIVTFAPTTKERDPAHDRHVHRIT